MKLLKLTLILTIPIFLASCGGGSDNTPTLNDDFDRSGLLANIHDNIIIPAFVAISGFLNLYMSLATYPFSFSFLIL